MTKPGRKRGRRPGPTTTRERICAHAAAAFSRAAYQTVTVRAIAREAGVDAALVHHYFGTKRALYDAAFARTDLSTVPPLEPVSALERASRAVRTPGERMLYEFLGQWDGEAARAAISALVRSAASEAESRRQLGEVIGRTIVAPAIASVDARHGMAKLRAALVAAQLVGIVWLRYVIPTEPLASASIRIVARTFGPSLDATLSEVDF